MSLCCYLRFLSTGKEIAGRLATLLLALGLVAHYFALLERSRGLHTVPYHDLYGSMSLFGWLLALTYLGLELYHRQRSVGAFVLPFILVFFVAAHLAPADRLSPAPAQGSHLRVSRHAEHSCVRGVCAFVCVQLDFSGRGAPFAEPQDGQRCVAAAAA